MKYSQWQKRIRTIGASALIAGVGMGVMPASAALVHGPFGLQGDIVSDAELSAMRGRFVDGRKITFFGVMMRTNWHRMGGEQFDMEMMINFDFLGPKFQPRLSLYHSTNLGPVSSDAVEPAELENVSDNGALDSVSGVVQNIQVAGDGNSVHNDVEWVVTDTDAGSGPHSLVELGNAGTQQHVSDDGVHTQVSANSEGIGYQVDIPDVGTVTQRISRSQLSGGNILQSTQLNSNLNQVLNSIGLTVELSPATSSVGGLRNFHRALDNMRGL